jgi:hypothetical protein
MPLTIPAEEAEFHALSYVDVNLRLFWWRGQLYRGIAKRDCEFYRNFFSSALAKDLMKDGLLVETELTDLAHPEFDLILKHKILPTVSYAYEWSFDALKAAALLTLRLQEALMEAGLYLRDPHPWNILFDGTKPVFVDIGAIVPARSPDWFPHDAIRRYYLNPLRLIGEGHGRIARALLRDADQQGIYDDEAYNILGGFAGERLKRRLFSAARAVLRPATRQALRKNLSAVPAMSSAARLQAVRRQISAVEFSVPENRWSGYYGETLPSFSSRENWTAKQRSVDAVLGKINPKSVLDIGSNKGWYSELAARRGARAVAFDTDEYCASDLYRRAKDGKLDIQPLVMNLCGPSGGAGLQGRLFPPATQRLRSEFVMALALEHHLVFREFLKFDQIVDALAEFSQRWLLVEFVPRGDAVVEEYGRRHSNPEQTWERHFSWYNLENFKAALGAKFSSIAEFPSDPEPRVLLLCEK